MTKREKQKWANAIDRCALQERYGNSGTCELCKQMITINSKRRKITFNSCWEICVVGKYYLAIHPRAIQNGKPCYKLMRGGFGKIRCRVTLCDIKKWLKIKP